MMDHLKRFCRAHGWALEAGLFLGLSLLWVLPWLLSGQTVAGNDLAFHLNRLRGLADQLRLGAPWWRVPPLSTTTFMGWGYPINLFYPAVMLLPAAWLQLMAWGARGFYLYLALVTWATLAIAAWVARRLLHSRLQGVLVALVYTFSQYRLIDFFVRGALGEGIAFAFLPLVFYGVYCIAYGDYRQWYWLAVGMAGVTLTHVLSVLLCAVGVVLFMGLWGLRRTAGWARLSRLGLATLLTLLLTASFLVPLAEQGHFLGHIGVQQYALADSAVRPGELVKNSLLTLTPTPDHLVSFGLMFWLLAGVTLLSWRKLTGVERYTFVAGWGCVWLATSWFPWAPFQPLLGMLQFPWRFLALASFPLAVVGIRAVMVLGQPANRCERVGLLMAIAVITVSFQVMGNVGFYHWVQGQPYGRGSLTLSGDYRAQSTQDPNGDYVTPRGLVALDAVRTHSLAVMNTQRNGHRLRSLRALSRETLRTGYRYHLVSTHAQWLKLPQLGYAGYRVTVNGRAQPLHVDGNDVVHVHVKAGRNWVTYRYHRTVLQRWSGWLSLVVWLGLLGTGSWRRWRHVNFHTK